MTDRLLGIDQVKSHDLDQILLDKNEIFRPGYTRISILFVSFFNRLVICYDSR